MSTHKPATRAEFKAAILRRLGSGVIDIDVTDDQIEDSIEEALKYFTAIANGTGTVSWTGLTEDHDDSLDSAVRVSGGSESYISGVTGQDIVLSLGSSRSARLHCVVWR